MRFLAAIILAATVPLVTSCESDTVFSVRLSTGQVTIRSGASTLILRNASSELVHYVALEERTSALVDLHFDPTQWPHVRPGEVVSIPYRDLTGYEPGARQARVYLWTRSGGYTHASIRL